jgi:hypothetical protein
MILNHEPRLPQASLLIIEQGRLDIVCVMPVSNEAESHLCTAYFPLLSPSHFLLIGKPEREALAPRRALPHP